MKNKKILSELNLGYTYWFDSELICLIKWVIQVWKFDLNLTHLINKKVGSIHLINWVKNLDSNPLISR